MKRFYRFLTVLIVCAAGFVPSLRSQEPVVAASDVDALFKSSDAKLQANKMVVYGIYRDLLQAGHWELAGKYLTDRYIQHNPNAASGREGVVKFFTEVLKVKPSPIPEKLTSPIVAVLAEGDLVTVLSVAERKDGAGKPYTTTWFDTWRIKDGKADEHWDCATKQ
jgi:predicted SnoaL-like aldol condensation-catalyzing enzyme